MQIDSTYYERSIDKLTVFFLFFRSFFFAVHDNSGIVSTVRKYIKTNNNNNDSHHTTMKITVVVVVTLLLFFFFVIAADVSSAFQPRPNGRKALAAHQVRLLHQQIAAADKAASAHSRKLMHNKNKNKKVTKIVGGRGRLAPNQICKGEFELCPTGECALISSQCGVVPRSSCPSGSYVCPPAPTTTTTTKTSGDGAVFTCAAKFSECPNLKNTVWDHTLSISERVDLLAAATTLEEQALQLSNYGPAIARVGVPAYQWLNDDLHGLRTNWTSEFGDSCSLGATWSRKALETVGRTIAEEARATHSFFTSRGIRGVDIPINGIGLTAYAPMINLVRDARWGRNQEAISECPTLNAALTNAYIRGMQRNVPASKLGRNITAGVACSKHYAVYDVESFPTARYEYVAQVSGRSLMEFYLPVFKSNIVEAGSRSVMCSYNSISTPVGAAPIPTCASHDLLTKMLRERWNASDDVWVMSDYDAAANLVWTHHYAANMTQAAAMAWNAGMDQEGGGTAVNTQLTKAVQANTIAPARITASFKRLFRNRLALGMFDAPDLYPDNLVPDPTTIGDNEHMQRVLDVAREAMVLYRNENETLPLLIGDAQEFRTCVIGPLAASDAWLLGNYAVAPNRAQGVSVLEGVMNTVCPFDNVISSSQIMRGFTISLLPGWEQQYPPVVINNPNATLLDCYALCQQNLQCNYWQFEQLDDHKNSYCYMLPVQGNIVPVPDPDVVASTIGARYGQSLLLLSQAYLQGSHSFISVKAYSHRECQQKCRVDRSCAYFTYNGLLGECYLLPNNAVPTPTSTYPAPEYVMSGKSPNKCDGVEFAAACADGSMQCIEPLGFSAAVRLASDKRCQQVVITAGLDQTIESEGHDRHSIELPESQQLLLRLVGEAAREAGNKLVAVLVHGGTFPINLERFDAILDAFYPGQLGGTAIADALFGLHAPAGRSPVTWYKSDKDLPFDLSHQDMYPNASANPPFLGYTYRYFAEQPLIPFGFGLTMSKFRYENLVVTPLQAMACDTITVTVTVVPVFESSKRKTRNVRGELITSDEVVQVYIKMPQASVPVPQVRLVAFERIKAVAYPTTVTLTFAPNQRAAVFENATHPFDSVEMIEAGKTIEIYVGGGQPDFTEGVLSEQVTVLGPQQPADNCA